MSIDITVDVPYPQPGAVRFTVSDPHGALSGTVPSEVVLAAHETTTEPITLTIADNTVQNDGARRVTITLKPSRQTTDPDTGTRLDVPYKLGTQSEVTLTVLDDDTAPAAPRNLTAVPADQQVTLKWDLPSANDIGTFNGYKVRYTSGSTPGGTWTNIAGATARTTSHTVTGLTNETEYTFQVRMGNYTQGDGAIATVRATPNPYGITVSESLFDESESTTLTIRPQGAPFDTMKLLTLVLASHPGPDQPKAPADFSVRTGTTIANTYETPFAEGGYSGRQRHVSLHIPAGKRSLVATLHATDDELSECREDMEAFVYLDYGTSNQRQVGTSLPVTIADNDNRPEVTPESYPDPMMTSATVSGRTVTLTFDKALIEVDPADDPLLEEDEVPMRAEMFFTLFEAKSANVDAPPENPASRVGDFYKSPYGTGARTFSLDGDTVTLTFPHHVDTTYGAWIVYDAVSRYSPLGVTPVEPKAGRCVKPVIVTDFTQSVPMNAVEPQPLPVITITQNAEVREGEGPMVFTVTLTPASTELVTVDFRTIARTAQSAMWDTSGNIHGDFWPIAGTIQFQPGDTEETVSVQIVDDSVEDDGETFLLDLSDVSGATMNERTSHGTGTIRNSEDAPTGNENTLTATFANVPAEHGGPGVANRFTFDLAFSENPEVSYRTLRDHAFTITGGDVKKAKRKVQGSNQSWTITVEPDGFGDVRLTLPGNRACSASNAVCMPDGRQLSNSPSATISGPAALSIADATANENSDSGLNFVVSLDRVSTLTVTVDYTTSDGTATAGQDYTATTGTLTFNPGDAAKSINVPLLDDAIDDGGETMTLTLSNASNARIADGTATGTIENSESAPEGLDRPVRPHRRQRRRRRDHRAAREPRSPLRSPDRRAHAPARREQVDRSAGRGRRARRSARRQAQPRDRSDHQHARSDAEQQLPPPGTHGRDERGRLGRLGALLGKLVRRRGRRGDAVGRRHHGAARRRRRHRRMDRRPRGLGREGRRAVPPRRRRRPPGERTVRARHGREHTDEHPPLRGAQRHRRGRRLGHRRLRHRRHDHRPGWLRQRQGPTST